MTDWLERALKTEWLIQWFTYLSYALWQITWYYAFKVKYNWITFLITWWGLLLFIAEIPKFIHEDNFDDTDWELCYILLRISAFISWAILTGLLFFWGRKPPSYVAKSQIICIIVWLIMFFVVIIIWKCASTYWGRQVYNGVIGFWGVLFPDIGFVMFAISLKKPKYSDLRLWTIYLIIIWFISAIVAVLFIYLNITSNTAAAIGKILSFYYFAIQNVWVYYANKYNALQEEGLKNFYNDNAEEELGGILLQPSSNNDNNNNNNNEREIEKKDKEEVEVKDKDKGYTYHYDDDDNDNNNVNNIDDIFEDLLIDWQYKYQLFGKEFYYLNYVWLLFHFICGLTLNLIILSLFISFIVIPVMILYLLDNYFLFCWYCRGYKQPITFNPIIYLRKIMADERLYLSTVNPMKHDICWKIRNYIQIYYSGLDRLLDGSLVGGEKELNHVDKYQSLYNNSLYFPCDGGISTADYNTSLQLYSDKQQSHEYSTLYNMHSVVYTFCPFYSLGQSMKIQSFNFISELHWKINNISKKNFIKYQTPKNYYIPNDYNNPAQLFASSVASSYYKFFGKEINKEDFETIKENMPGLLLIGSIPDNFSYLLSGKLLSTCYWKLVSLWRRILLQDNKDSEITKLIINLSKKYNYFNNKETLNNCINSFCVEIFPGAAGISNAIIEGLKLFNKDKKYIQDFIESPENFVLECIRISGVPYAGKTLLRGYDQININNNYINLYTNNAIISQVATIGRCPYKFDQPNIFNSKRDNLKKDVYSFGSTEQLIRQHKASKQCPLHDFSIIIMQELLARIQGVDITVSYQDQQFPNSYQK